MVDGFLQDLWNAAKTAGPFANLFLLLALYFMNKERTAYRNKIDELNEVTRERVVQAINNATSAIRDLTSMFAAKRGDE